MNEHMAEALHEQLRSKGRKIRSTVVPKEWEPKDQWLNDAAAWYQRERR